MNLFNFFKKKNRETYWEKGEETVGDGFSNEYSVFWKREFF